MVLILAALLICVACSSAGAQVQTLPRNVADNCAREQELLKARLAEEAARQAHDLELKAKEAEISRQKLKLKAGRVRLETVEPAPPPVELPGGRIFVPTPKDQTLDDAQSASAQTVDKVTTTQGDLLIGKVLAIEGGKLRFTAPHYQGEVFIFTESLARVQLASQGHKSGPAEVVLTNGDSIRGSLVAITPEAVAIESDIAGPLKILRSVVSSIAFTGAKRTFLSSRFSSGSLEPWKVRAGDFSVKDKQLVLASRGNRNQAIYAELDQAEPLTFVAKVKATARGQLYCYLVAFADTIQGYYGRNSVLAQFRSHDCRIGFCQNGGLNMPSAYNMGRQVQGGVLRFAYDPATGQATTWLDSTQLGVHTIGSKPTKGKYVIFISRYPCQISYVRVLRGIVPPAGGVGTETKPDSDTHSIEFANKDSISATQVLLTDSIFTAETEHGQLSCPLEKVKMLVFATKGLHKPRRNKRDALVETPDSRLTLEFDRLTDKYLLGSCEHLGQVKLLRSAVQSVGFNLYAE